MEYTDEEKAKIRAKIEALKNNKFKQQTLPAWRPVPSFLSTLITFLIFGVLFLVLGIVLFVMSNQIQEQKFRYDTKCPALTEARKAAGFDYPDFLVPNADCDGEYTFTVDKKMEAPVYFYYQLENFYQNHRRYVKSRSFDQLRGESDYTIEDCDPIEKNKQLGWVWAADKKTKLDETANAVPCGLVAKSFFNDTFKLSEIKDNGQEESITIKEDNIAWESDVKYKFANQKGDWEKTQWIDMEDPHFIVWMRTAGLPDFRKLWGRIETDLEAGSTYKINISSNYPVDKFDGKKSWVLSTTNELGGKNLFLAICYIVVGILCLVFALIFGIAYYRKKNANRGN